jgi:hypothetical protein
MGIALLDPSTRLVRSMAVTAELENERVQLLDHWKKQLTRNPDWIFSELRQVRQIMAASNGDEKATQSLGSHLRQFHDKLGFKAKGSVTDGGLCAGAIFRTQTFIETKERIGSKVRQSVHIEHTFPIRQLRIEIGKCSFESYADALNWLLMHSVTTAFHESEKEHLAGRASSSDALNPTSPEYLKPFARYEKLHQAAGVVWNVFDRQKVDPQTFTFEHHFEVVLGLLEEAGASSKMVSVLRTYTR